MENMVNFQELVNLYCGKKIFLTGHTGFKGSWLLKILSLLGAEIKGYALEPQTSNDLFNLIGGNDLCDSIIGDLRNKKKLEKEILDFQPDFIFHLAAQPLVRLSYEIPVETFEVNAIGTANVLDSARLLNKKCSIILITTDKVYHNYEWIYPYRESDRLGGYDPYSASKACSELIIESYRNSFFNILKYEDHLKGIAVARAGNVIGGGDWAKDRLIPDIVRSLINQKPISIRNPNSVRPWQHVLEPLLGYLTLGVYLEKQPIEYSSAYNFGPQAEDALSVENMLELAINSWGSGEFMVEKQINQPHEAGLLKLDISKVKSELNWIPKFNAIKTINYTLDWYKAFIANSSSINEFTEEQIMNFINC
ncbi:CDP-glucose 4,6-dehydratase [Aquirufa sp. HETE-83D]|uniref:CDP-glucose 4,6-dehydratase n=1 Tax=Aquirufa esocilacus TaxID=3096513 RepID=A0ABW6DLC0_9BACT